MESPGKLYKMKDLRERLSEKVSLRNIDSVLTRNGTKNIIAQSELSQNLKASKPRLA